MTDDLLHDQYAIEADDVLYYIRLIRILKQIHYETKKIRDRARGNAQ